MLIGTHIGTVLHLTRFGDAASPRQYTPLSHMVGDAVTCICMHPLLDELFVVGYQSGLFAIFRQTKSRSICSWPSESLHPPGIQSIVWSNHRPSVLFVLDSAGAVSVWDLGESDIGPCFTYGGRGATRGKDDVICAIAVNGKGSNSCILSVVYEDGRVEGHVLDDVLSEAGIDEATRFESYINSL